MELILEVLLELILEGTIEISKSKKVPNIVRYPLIIFIILLFIGVLLVIFCTCIIAYQKINKICGILLIIIGIIMLVSSVIKFKKIYFKKDNK